jgi:hypothetical protein
MVPLALGLLLLLSPDAIPALTIPNGDSMQQMGGMGS